MLFVCEIVGLWPAGTWASFQGLRTEEVAFPSGSFTDPLRYSQGEAGRLQAEPAEGCACSGRQRSLPRVPVKVPVRAAPRTASTFLV